MPLTFLRARLKRDNPLADLDCGALQSRWDRLSGPNASPLELTAAFDGLLAGQPCHIACSYDPFQNSDHVEIIYGGTWGRIAFIRQNYKNTIVSWIEGGRHLLNAHN